ncbi:hypothetical protein ABES02_05025 [Neobacillus pocheonensis]|uniref:hypothetical protein n=1 Tax=Neobacillus pocheonensis TaxID=363869 RepID=UPI003D274AF1
MVVVHFLENKTVVLTQLRTDIPTIDENIKIKGRKGKVLNVKNIEDNVIHVYVVFEQVIKKQLAAKDNKNKKR